MSSVKIEQENREMRLLLLFHFCSEPLYWITVIFSCMFHSSFYRNAIFISVVLVYNHLINEYRIRKINNGIRSKKLMANTVIVQPVKCFPSAFCRRAK